MIQAGEYTFFVVPPGRAIVVSIAQQDISEDKIGGLELDLELLYESSSGQSYWTHLVAFGDYFSWATTLEYGRTDKR